MKSVYLLSILIFIQPIFSQASVNMRNGSYSESWVDFVEPGEGFELKIERYYNSRSLFTGIFGFGWCTGLETFIEVTSDGILNLTECGGGLEVTYYPDNFDLRSVNHTVEAIIKSMQKKKKLTANDIINLRAQLTANTKMRFEYANQLHLVDINKIKNGSNTFYAKSRGLEKITFNGQLYERKKFDGTIERYNKNGQLIQLLNAIGAWAKLQYKGKNLIYLVDNKGRRLNFSYSTSGKLAKVSNGRGHDANYVFAGDNLIKVTNMWDKEYTYTYDPAHNLSAVQFPDKSSIRMTYDNSNDWVKSYTNRKNCRETFDFVMSTHDPKNHYWSTVEKTCDKKNVASGKHEFWYQAYNFSQDKYLHRAQETANKDFKDIYFHPFLGRPVSLRENDVYMGFAYFLNGLLNKKEFKKYVNNTKVVKWSKATYKYEKKQNRLVQVNSKILDTKGKVQSTYSNFFDYNKSGLLTKVRTSKSESVFIYYDSSGRIASLKNHKNTVINLDYSPGIDRPTKISQAGIGEIVIQYDGAGEISSIESNPKRKIASSVISSFLEMIEVLGPLGEILKF